MLFQSSHWLLYQRNHLSFVQWENTLWCFCCEDSEWSVIDLLWFDNWYLIYGTFYNLKLTVLFQSDNIIVGGRRWHKAGGFSWQTAYCRTPLFTQKHTAGHLGASLWSALYQVIISLCLQSLAYNLLLLVLWYNRYASYSCKVKLQYTQRLKLWSESAR